ncbi:MAG: YgaP family membrane protein [Anaerolineae bacterium]
MKRNEGTTDRIIRAILAVIFLVVGLGPLRALQGAVLGIIVAVVGLILAFTAITGFCLIYQLLGISTTGTRKE